MAYANADELASALISAINTQFGGEPATTIEGAIQNLWTAGNANAASATSEAIETSVAQVVEGVNSILPAPTNNLFSAFSGLVDVIRAEGVGLGDQIANVGFQTFLDQLQVKALVADALSGVTGTVSGGRISNLVLIKNGVTLASADLSADLMQTAYVNGTTAAVFAAVAALTDMAAGLLTQPPVGDSGVFQGII